MTAKSRHFEIVKESIGKNKALMLRFGIFINLEVLIFKEKMFLMASN